MPPPVKCYFVCTPCDYVLQYPCLIGVSKRTCWPFRAPLVLCYTSGLYSSAPNGTHNGTCGKWLTPNLFVPPLALFATPEEAQAMLALELATSF